MRLKSGDPTVFGRLDEEIDAVDAAGIDWRIVPGITAASAAVAGIGQSLTTARPQRLGPLPDRARHEGLCRT